MLEVDWKRPYRYLVALYYALITVAGSIVVLCHWPFWSRYAVPVSLDRLLLFTVLFYVVLDSIRIPFASGSTISLSFPIVLTVLLVSSNPANAVTVAICGSLVSEYVYSLFYRRLQLEQAWIPALIQATLQSVLYAGHHAVAGFTAAIAFLLLNPSLEPAVKHLSAIAAYVLAYGITSTLVLWPHDWWVVHLLASDEERLPRVEIVSTLVVLTPIPVVLIYLYELAKAPSRLVVYPLALLFLGLLLLARSFAKTESENGKRRTEDYARTLIGTPPNLSQVVQNVFGGVECLVKYQWGAIYSTEVGGETFRLRGQKGADGVVRAYGLRIPKEPVLATELSPVQWPTVVRPEDAYLGTVARQGIPLVSFERVPLMSRAYRLPARTAFMVLPICVEGKVIGLLALARSGKLFTLTERSRVQALTEVLGNTFYSVQCLEGQLQALYDEIEQFAHPDIVQQALNELIELKVNVPRLLAAISERAFQTNLRAVLQEMVAGRNQHSHLALPADDVKKIYQEIQSEAKDMPIWSPEIMGRLQTVTSALSFAFGFRYRWPELARSPEYEELYKICKEALSANTAPDIVAQEHSINHAIEYSSCSSLAARYEICDLMRSLLEIVALLQKAQDADASTKTEYLGDALKQLRMAEESARNKLEDPERLMFVQVAATWQTVVTNELYAVQEGSAQLVIALSSHRVLPLEEVTVQLRLENNGQGLASEVIAEIQPSEDYIIGDGQRVELGPLPAGNSRELDFKIRPLHGRDMLRVVFEIIYRDRGGREKREVFADRVCLREALAPFVEIDSPYVASGALDTSSPLFFGREDVFRFIKRNITGSVGRKRVLLLVGERRTGKTSIVKQLPERLKDEPYVHVFCDCQRIAEPGLVGFFYVLSSAIAEGLEKAGLTIERVPFGDLKGQPQLVFEEKFLPQVWRCVGDHSLLLAVDEFEALEEKVRQGQLEPAVFPYLRSLMQSQSKITFVFVGTHRIEELATDYWSVLFNIAKYKRIGFLDRQSAIRLITEPVRSYGVVYDDLALHEVLHLTAGHPYLLQLVCDCVMEHCNDQRRNYVTIQDVRDVRDQIVEQGRAYLVFVWGQSSPVEKAALAALASLLHIRQQVTASNIVEHLAYRIGNLTDKVLFDLSAIRKALRRLIERGIVRETAQEDPYYAFTADLYREFTSKHNSLSKILPELVKEAVAISPTSVPAQSERC